MQCNAIQYNAIQYNAMQYNTFILRGKALSYQLLHRHATKNKQLIDLLLGLLAVKQLLSKRHGDGQFLPRSSQV